MKQTESERANELTRANKKEKMCKYRYKHLHRQQQQRRHTCMHDKLCSDIRVCVWVAASSIAAVVSPVLQNCHCRKWLYSMHVHVHCIAESRPKIREQLENGISGCCHHVMSKKRYIRVWYMWMWILLYVKYLIGICLVQFIQFSLQFQ